MNAPSGNYDRVARVYRAFEYAAFGRDLERARFSLLPGLADCATLLIIGEGDGRLLQKLLQLNARAAMHCLDLSPAMLARARQRIGAEAARVQFQVADIRSTVLPAKHYDAVVTCFVLDCFSAEDCAAIIARIVPALRPGSRWLWADFVLPPSGLRRLRARLWLAVLFSCFRWATRQTVRELPPAETLITAAGFQPLDQRGFQGGLLRSVLFSQPGSGTRSS